MEQIIILDDENLNIKSQLFVSFRSWVITYKAVYRMVEGTNRRTTKVTIISEYPGSYIP